MNEHAARRMLQLGVVIFVGGIVRDLVWHAGHDEFEGTRQQFEAHWLLWIGFVLVVAAVGVGVFTQKSRIRHPGHTVVLAAAAIYLPVTVWHFVAHANGVDPVIAHPILGIGDATIIAGAVWALRTSALRPVTVGRLSQ